MKRYGVGWEYGALAEDPDGDYVKLTDVLAVLHQFAEACEFVKKRGHMQSCLYNFQAGPCNCGYDKVMGEVKCDS